MSRANSVVSSGISGSRAISASRRYASSRRPPARMTASRSVIESRKAKVPGRWTAPKTAISRAGRKPVEAKTVTSSNSRSSGSAAGATFGSARPSAPTSGRRSAVMSRRVESGISRTMCARSR
ncbi:MAG: hypothetical protein A2083_10035 [Gemmatimonadetes bacterium GWC2_71_9]|nr:MAG: hypothetical protein A2083_10035 [Gemmatimonadetes bacterium GWC2_71_9]